jgi:hypothetical protein
MKTYTVTVHMNNGDRLYLNDICANNDEELLNLVLFNENTNAPTTNKFARALQADHKVCYCVGQVSSVHYKEKENYELD